MATRAISGILLCTLAIAGCEADPIARVPIPEWYLPTTSSPQRVVASSFSEFRSCTGIPEKELDSCKEALAEARARVAALEKENAQVAAALAAAQGRIVSLEQDTEKLAAALATAASTQASLDQTRSQLAGLEKDIAGSRESEKRLAAELESARAAVAELQQASLQQRRRAEDLQLQALESEQELTHRKAALADTTRHLTALEQDRQKVAMNLADAQAKIQQLAAGLAAEQAKTAALTEENKRLNLNLISLKQSLESEIEKRDIQIRESRGQLVITMLDRLLFDSGQTEIKPTALQSLHEVSVLLKKATGKEIRIEGHTDNKPIRGSLHQRYPSNWELSAARATRVAHYLVETEGIAATRLSVVGYADTRPVTSNATEEGRSQNRRIEIVLYPKALVRSPGGQPPDASSPAGPPP
jgi:chemotaxis protein MotB